MEKKLCKSDLASGCRLLGTGGGGYMLFYVKPKDSELNTLMQSVDKFMNCVDSLDEFRILGGDPFMSKDLYKIINKLVKMILLVKI